METSLPRWGNMGVELFDLDWVQAIVLFFSQLGWALFGVSLVVCIFECGIDYTTGRANIKDTALNILKGFLSVCLFTTVPVRLYSLSVTLQGTFASGSPALGPVLEQWDSKSSRISTEWRVLQR